MNRRIHPKPPAPSDDEILAYDNVPVDVAARYLDWTENTVRLALREGRASFGTAVRNNGITHKISPGVLVRYKREGAPSSLCWRALSAGWSGRRWADHMSNKNAPAGATPSEGRKEVL